MFVSGWFRPTSRDFCESLIDVDFDLEEIHCCDSPSHAWFGTNLLAEKTNNTQPQGWILSLAHSQAVLDEARRELDRKQLRERRPFMFCNVLECLAKKGGYDKSTQNQLIFIVVD